MSNKILVLRKLFFLSFLVFSFNNYCQNESYPTGVVKDSIAVNSSTETYTLYLPTTFEQNRLSSIVFIFEPGARGKIGIKPFIEAAEKYNYILVCSNDFKNGIFEENFNIINRLFSTVFDTYNIDENRIYTAGFSGGSRVATAVAVLTKQMQGVIACGAGFSPNNSHIPMSKENFSYVGLVGDRDMNYQEMLRVKDWLNKFQIDNEIFTYDDDHSWPPSEQILRAFAWLETQAYKKKIKIKDEGLLDESFQNNYKAAKILENTNRIEQSVWEYERIKRNYSRYYKLDSISLKIKQLKESRIFNEDSKRRLAIKDDEAKIRKTFVQRFSKEIASKKTPINYKWWIKEIEKLNNNYIKSNNSQYKKMGERVGYAVYAMAIETANTQLRENKIKKALYCHEIVAIIIPERPYPYYLLAKDYAILNEEERVFENLEIAISKGLNNKELLISTEEFKEYKNYERFELLLSRIEN